MSMAVVVATGTPPTGHVRCWDSTSATARTRRSGAVSSPASSSAGSAGPSWSFSDQHSGLVEALKCSFQTACHQGSGPEWSATGAPEIRGVAQLAGE
ncbi:hypothetical protein [Nocardioides endophyticus]|uniref:hypothetical protein n=1 Tax=Nocardioides endophyticus TaxID=1353775 RepID=UPI003CD05704